MRAKAGFANGATGFGMPLRAAGSVQPRGSRWYAVHVDRGAEDAVAEKLSRSTIFTSLTSAFVLKKERWFKSEGAWVLREVPLYPEYVIATSNDAERLALDLRKATFRAQLAGEGSNGFASFDPTVANWFARNVDESSVIRASVGEIENGKLCVVSGPLVGQEERVGKIDRHKRACVVELGGEDAVCTETLALNVPVKR